MKILNIVITLLILFVFFSCDLIGENQGNESFKFNEHYLVFDFQGENGCVMPVMLSYNGKLLPFVNSHIYINEGGNGEGTFFDSLIYWASPHCQSGNTWNCTTDSGDEVYWYFVTTFILTNNCRLLVDVDSLHADPEGYDDQLEDQPNDPFYFEMVIYDPATGQEAVIADTYKPIKIAEYDECRDDRRYYLESPEYVEMLHCINSLPAHGTVNFAPPSTQIDWVQEIYNFLGPECVDIELVE